MNYNDSVDKLRSEFGYWPAPARATVEANGICQYCKEDLLVCRPGYSSIAVDHLLPKSVYPEFADDERNWLLACASCNGMKGGFDPLREGEDPGKMLGMGRTEMIQRVVDHLEGKVEDRTNEWRRVLEIVRGAQHGTAADRANPGG